MQRTVLAFLCLSAAACGSQPAERQPPAAPPTAFDGAAVTNASAQLAHGKRLTAVLGCTGCHGNALEGERFYELYASNLTREVPKYSDGQLERLLRHGERIDGKDLWGMPSETFQHLSDADLDSLTAYLRSLTPAGKPTQPALPFEKETKELIAKGEFKPAADFVREQRSMGPADLGSDYALGRYITTATCAECHGPRLEGNPGDSPNLIVVGGYSRAEFERLITRGIPTGNRKLKHLMVDVAQTRFAYLTQHERDALYAYLKARADRPQ